MHLNILRTRLAGVLAASLLALAPLGASAQTINGTVTDGGKTAVGGVTVYLVPAADVAKLKKAPRATSAATSTTTSRWKTTWPPTATSTSRA